MDDAALVKSFQDGSPPGREDAFRELVARHRRQVYRVARGVLRDHARADEAAQDAFVKAWRGLASFKNESSFRTWMYRIAMNAALDLAARESTARRTAEQAAREQATADGSPRGPRALERVLEGERLATLRAAVARLPERQRLVLTLKVHEDLKYTEVAEVLGCPVGTVKANFHHAVTNLRRYLREAGESVPEPGAAAGEESA